MTPQQVAELMPDVSQLDSDEPELESSLHYLQLALLVTCLEWFWQDRNDFFIGANLTVYYSQQQLKNREFRGPDFFLIKNTAKQPRRSWVVWQEDGRYPDLIIELLSPATAQADRTEKKDLYQNRWRTPEYFWFSPDTFELAGFRLVGGRYQEILPNNQGQRWSEELELYLGGQNEQLRYFTPDGELVPTPTEAADQAQTLLAEERQRSQIERQRAERLAERLRALGIDPEDNST